jgi:TonB family protein
MNNTENWKSWEGRVVAARFPLRQWLGGSDHSAVFLTDLGESPSQKAALKLVPASVPDADLQISRWRGTVHLSHPHLIRLFEVGRCEFDSIPLFYVVTEYAEEDLSQILPQRPLTAGEAREMLPPVLDALAYLHAHVFLHGHLKPSNILAVDNQLKLSTDRLVVPGASIENANLSIFDPPELRAGTISPASDIWSLGVTLVTALTQHPAADSQPSRNPARPEMLAEPFRSIARDCLKPDPKLRCTIDEIRARLQSDADPRPITPDPIVPKRGFGLRTWLPLGVLLLAVAFFAARSLTHSEKQPGSPVAAPQEQAPEFTPSATPAPVTPPKETPTQTQKIPGRVIGQVIPEVPRSARNTIQGKVKVSVRVDVDPSGKVRSAKLTSAGPSKYFANMALKSAQGWEFSAPEVGGQKVPSSWILHFLFGRASTQVVPEKENR